MSFNFKYLPDVALADVAFEVDADTWQDLLAGSAVATTGVMVDLSTMRPDRTRHIDLVADSLESLVYDWLSELVYLKDTEGLFGRDFSFDGGEAHGWQVTAHIVGETIDRKRHLLGQDVKAVTLHLFEAGIQNGRYHARVVLDI
jgi:SHS2 domain-containing protein